MMVDTRLKVCHRLGRVAGEEGSCGDRGEAHGRWPRQIPSAYPKGSIDVFPRSSRQSFFSIKETYIVNTDREWEGNERLYYTFRQLETNVAGTRS